MVDLDILKAKGISSENLKALFEPDRNATLPVDKDREDKIKNLRNRIRSRICNGRDRNIANWKYYYALDKAWDIPFNQITFTLLQTLMSKDISDEATKQEVNNSLKSWGFRPEMMFREIADPKSPGKTIRQLDVPSFFTIFVPLVRAYVTIRWARILNIRRVRPFLKYEPSLDNVITRLQSEVITNRIGDVMARQYGYWNVLKQSVFQMLHYSFCVQFPQEEWDSEEQLRENEGGEPTVQTVKEGIRYHMPHPCRTFYDLSHRPSTMNTDSGCKFAGYWKVFKYKDVRTNPKFWNKDKITIGNLDWWTSPNTVMFFNAVYNGCVISLPTITPAENKDRENTMMNQFYTMAQDDASVLMTEYFERLIPSEEGLGDYDYPVWFRFVIGGDDTILYCAPTPYVPPIWYGYDADENRAENASLSLEVLPFQDHVSNLLTQFILTVKQNLSNITFVDTDVVGQDWIDKLRNWGEQIFRVRNFYPFSGRKALKAQQNVPAAFFSHHFPALDSNGIITAINTVINVMERTLVMSAQEVGQAASHELREKEVINIANATSTRLEFTSNAVDDAREAWKDQLYKGLMAYGDEEFYSQIPYDERVTPQMLTAMGFTWDQQKHPRQADGKSITVLVKKTAIAPFTFCSNQDWLDRNDDTKMAAAMAQALSGWMANPMLAQAIGPDQAIGIINMICKLAKFPKEFRLENKAQFNQAQQEQQVQMIAQYVEKQLMPEIQAALKNMMDFDKKQQTDIDELKKAVMQITQLARPAQYDQPTTPNPNAQFIGEPNPNLPVLAEPAGV